MAKLDMTIPVPVRFSQDDIIEKMKAFMPSMQKSGDISSLKEKWQKNVDQFSFKVKGQEIAGKLTIMAHSIVLTATIPFAASFFKGQIADSINQHVKSFLRY